MKTNLHMDIYSPRQTISSIGKGKSKADTSKHIIFFCLFGFFLCF